MQNGDVAVGFVLSYGVVMSADTREGTVQELGLEELDSDFEDTHVPVCCHCVAHAARSVYSHQVSFCAEKLWLGT